MALGGLAIGALAGGALGGLFGKKKATTQSTLSGPQSALLGPISDRLRALIQSGGFQGNLTTPITPEEQAQIDRFGQLNLQGADTFSRLQQLGTDPTEFNENFRREIFEPQFQNFRSDIIPFLEEALPFSSSARGIERGRALRGFNQDILAQRFAGRESARDRALRSAQSSGTAGLQAAALAGIPREIQQAGLDREFQRFLANNEMARGNINAALNFLGIQTQAQTPGVSRFDAGLAGATAGSQLGLLAALLGGGSQSSQLQGRPREPGDVGPSREDGSF